MDINTKFGYWLTIAQTARYSMGKHSRPMFVADKQTPETLNEITIGLLSALTHTRQRKITLIAGTTRTSATSG